MCRIIRLFDLASNDEGCLIYMMMVVQLIEQYLNHRKMLLDSLMEGIEHKYYDIHNIFKWLVGSIQQHLLGMANKCLERLT